MVQRDRLTVVEYGKFAVLEAQHYRHYKVTDERLRQLLLRAGERVRSLLRLDSVPIVWNADRIQCRDFAGLLVLGPGLELEVAPKFLGNAVGWREDFFLLATLSHHGRLLDDDELRSSARATSDLGTLMGRSLIQMYWRNQRHPLRSYRRFGGRDFAIEGDFDPEDLAWPGDDGFWQQMTAFTRANPYNAVIRAAATQLASAVTDAQTRARLERVAKDLPRQRRPTRVSDRRLPSRSRSWQRPYDLSGDVLRGFGGAYDPKNSLAPGFVLQTWRAWEHLVSLAMRAAFGGQNVCLQSRHHLGTRRCGNVSTELCVRPDVTVSVGASCGNRRCLVDAKYKGHFDRGSVTIANADIYEALAFARAALMTEVVLVYPRRIESRISRMDAAGHAAEFSRVEVGDIRVRAVELGVRGISERGGLLRFVNALRAAVSTQTLL